MKWPITRFEITIARKDVTQGLWKQLRGKGGDDTTTIISSQLTAVSVNIAPLFWHSVQFNPKKNGCCSDFTLYFHCTNFTIVSPQMEQSAIIPFDVTTDRQTFATRNETPSMLPDAAPALPDMLNYSNIISNPENRSHPGPGEPRNHPKCKQPEAD